MTTTYTAHGIDFVIELDGFPEPLIDAAKELIVEGLDDLLPHAIHLMTRPENIRGSVREQILDDIISRVHSVITDDWTNPNAASITISINEH